MSLPRRLERLADLAYNLWWTWTSDAARLQASRPESWEASAHNPVDLLRMVPRRSTRHARPSFMEHYARALVPSTTTWHRRQPVRSSIRTASTNRRTSRPNSATSRCRSTPVVSASYRRPLKDQRSGSLVAMGFYRGYFQSACHGRRLAGGAIHPLAFKDLPVFRPR
jgi:hypothetical protein